MKDFYIGYALIAIGVCILIFIAMNIYSKRRYSYYISADVYQDGKLSHKKAKTVYTVKKVISSEDINGIVDELRAFDNIDKEFVVHLNSINYLGVIYIKNNETEE